MWMGNPSQWHENFKDSETLGVQDILDKEENVEGNGS